MITCTINGKDALATWGVVIGPESVSNLMSPPPLKPFTQNSSRAEDGKRVTIKNPRYDERDLTLLIYIQAKTESDFLAKYSSFLTELKTGALNITTSMQPTVVYKTTYRSCNQFAQFNGRLAKFVLTLNEPNPADRTA